MKTENRVPNPEDFTLWGRLLNILERQIYIKCCVWLGDSNLFSLSSPISMIALPHLHSLKYLCFRLAVYDLLKFFKLFAFLGWSHRLSLFWYYLCLPRLLSPGLTFPLSLQIQISNCLWKASIWIPHRHSQLTSWKLNSLPSPPKLSHPCFLC